MSLLLDGTDGITHPDGEVQASAPLGEDQTWQVMTGSRAVSTEYTNTTGRPIVATIRGSSGGTNTTIYGYVDGVILVADFTTAGGRQLSIQLIIPDGGVYKFTGSITGMAWMELR